MVMDIINRYPNLLRIFYHVVGSMVEQYDAAYLYVNKKQIPSFSFRSILKVLQYTYRVITRECVV